MEKVIYLAGGCFWGVEEYFKQITGVVETSVGYANGKTNTPTYKELKVTDHAETVMVKYDDTVVNLGFILGMYFKVIDPMSVNKQGEDVGRQYRTGIYYEVDSDLAIIEKSIADLEVELGGKTAIEVEKLDGYYLAEDYHQDYLEKNPTGYCHIGKEKFEMAKQAKAN